METAPEYRALLAVDIADSAGRGDVALELIRRELATALRASFARSGVDWDACLRHDLGDGMRVAAPAGTPKAALIHPLLHELTARLRAHNLLAGPPTRVRVRVALHAGEIRVGADGSAIGRPLEVLARLLDAEPARAALARDPEVTAAVLVSQHFHEETVWEGRPGIDPAAFREVAVRVKKFAAPAWLHVPLSAAPGAAEPGGAGAGPGEPEDARGRTPDDGRAGTARMTSKASGHGVVYAVGNGVININRRE
ncbi:hypothetical protein [Streptomyces pratensis]|uniref:hypothetical protein n=1 Tax=Streptomyces pratensis TaxID=1169025 RepID=UPI0030186260